MTLQSVRTGIGAQRKVPAVGANSLHALVLFANVGDNDRDNIPRHMRHVQLVCGGISGKP